MKENDAIFRTVKGYEQANEKIVTATMEDYLEMIFRLTVKEKSNAVRVGEVADNLSVRPSSASKMIVNLRERGLVEFERYGLVFLSSNGREQAEYLMKRHDVLNRFYCLINHTESELELVELTEHYFDKRTVDNICELIDMLEKEGINKNEKE